MDEEKLVDKYDFNLFFFVCKRACINKYSKWKKLVYNIWKQQFVIVQANNIIIAATFIRRVTQ